ncbi:MAG: hypothetical protein A2Z45_05765 [Chloroflexi bacterium RBG_19FT_COMBO_55_16]|nr:MAG: hypothetical protein A2Z45_05765 [Chloroflexi bacterium RBG_19FT_COMBO_55_16]
MDELDRKLISLLLANPDETNKALAQVLHASESTIRRRRQSLFDTGILRSTVVADPFRLGYTIMALIGMQIEHRFLNSIVKALLDLPGLRFIGLTLGRYDILTEAWFKSNEELLNFVTDVLGQIPGIQRTETLQVLKLVKYGYDWGQPSQDINGSS